MKEQFAHKITNSFMLWFDNFLLTKGEAFSNKTGTFYNTDDPFIDSSFESFSSPYKQFVNDSSISGAVVKTGIQGFDLPTYTVSDNDEVASFSAVVGTGVSAPFTFVTTGFFEVTGNLISGSENYINDWVSFEPDYTVEGSGIPSDGEFLRFNKYTEIGKEKFQLYVHNGTAAGSATNNFFRQNPPHPLEIHGYPWGGDYNKNAGANKRIKRFFDPKDSSGNLIDNDLFFINFSKVDYGNGRLITTGTSADYSESSDVTGTFAVKDFNIYFSNETEEDLIVEQKFTVNSRVPNSITSGIAPYDQVVPAIFLSTASIQNEGLAFGGEESTTVRANAVILAEDSYQLDGVLSIFADSHNEIFYPIPMTGHPVDEYGDLKDGTYNYNTLKNKYNSNKPFLVESATTSKLTDKARKSLANDLYVGFIDFDIKINRFRFS